MIIFVVKIKGIMKTLLRHVTIIDTDSSYHGQTQDVLIEDGNIKQISSEITCQDADEVLENCYISQGWADSSVSFGEPGYEERETLAHGAKVACESGFTQVMLNPNTHPITESRSQVGFLKPVSYTHLTLPTIYSV